MVDTYLSSSDVHSLQDWLASVHSEELLHRLQTRVQNMYGSACIIFQECTLNHTYSYTYRSESVQAIREAGWSYQLQCSIFWTVMHGEL